MPILDLQRRLREAGRIRIGEAVPAKKRDGSATTRPKKLETFRFTSPDRESVDAIAGLYGGDVRKWEGAPAGEQWEVVTQATSVPVMLPPGPLASSQWYELWSGGGCVRRCDGQTEVISESPCQCDPDERECKPHTRLSVILTDLQGIGVWRLDTQGWYAATELAGAMEMVALMQTAGRLVSGHLVLTQKEQRKPGEPVRKFAVPGLDLDVRPGVALTGGAADAPALSPVPASDEPVPTVAEQIEAVSHLAPRVRRTNTAPPVARSGLEPRTAAESEIVTNQQAEYIVAMLNSIDDPEARSVAKRTFAAAYGVPTQLPVAQFDEALAFATDLALGPADTAPTYPDDTAAQEGT